MQNIDTVEINKTGALLYYLHSAQAKTKGN